MSEKNLAVAISNTHTEAEAAVKELQKSGFDIKRSSIVGKDYHSEENVVGYYNTGDRVKYWGKLGAFWGGIWGLLFGSAFFFIPGIGPIVVGGPLVAHGTREDVEKAKTILGTTSATEITIHHA